MAINVSRDNSSPQKPKLTITLDNGDLEALEKALKKWSFKDETSLLRFIIAVLLATDQNVLYIDADGVKRKLEPIEELLEPKGKKDAAE